MSETRWRKASRSGEEGNCIELAHTLDAVRDSKDPEGPRLVVNVLSLLGAIHATHRDNDCAWRHHAVMAPSRYASPPE
jgi:hypothetical protein